MKRKSLTKSSSNQTTLSKDPQQKIGRGRPRIPKPIDKFLQFVGLEFTAQGQAKNKYKILSVKPVLLERIKDHTSIEVSEEDLLKYLRQSGVI